MSGVWVGARKLEGELDVEQRRIVRLFGESIVVTAEPAGSGTAARVWPPYEEEDGRDTAQGSDGFIAL